MMMRGPDGGPWGIKIRDAESLVMALEEVPIGAELWKNYTTGNLCALLDGELVGIIDLVEGEYHSLDEDTGG